MVKRVRNCWLTCCVAAYGNRDEEAEADEAKAKVRAAKKEFNIKPKKGLKMLIECGAVEDTPPKIAALLFEGDG